METAIEEALADDDADPGDLLPSVLAAHRSHPAPPADGRPAARLRGGDPRGARARAGSRPGRDRDGRGHRRGRRRLPRDGGPVRALRRRADPGHAADRERVRRLRDRRRAHRAPSRRSSSSSPTSPAVAFDQIVNQAAKLRFMTGGAAAMPLVLRMVSGGGVRLGAQHSQSLEALFAHIPGLVVVMPSPAVRREGPPRGGDPRRQPGHLPRAEAPVLRRAGARAGRAIRRRARQRAHRSRGQRRHGRRARRHGRACAPRRARARGGRHRRRGARSADARAARHARRS